MADVNAILEQIKTLTLLEAAQLVKGMEEAFGVSAAAAVAVAAPAAEAVKAGCDLDCGTTYARALPEAVAKGLLAENDLDRAVRRLLQARFRLGLFDPPGTGPHANIPSPIRAGCCRSRRR